MGKQYNKLERRARRQAYLKRKQTRAKTAVTGKAAAAKVEAPAT